jgi:hypothetical protein
LHFLRNGFGLPCQWIIPLILRPHVRKSLIVPRDFEVQNFITPKHIRFLLLLSMDGQSHRFESREHWSPRPWNELNHRRWINGGRLAMFGWVWFWVLLQMFFCDYFMHLSWSLFSCEAPKHSCSGQWTHIIQTARSLQMVSLWVNTGKFCRLPQSIDWYFFDRFKSEERSYCFVFFTSITLICVFFLIWFEKENWILDI